MNQTYSVAHGAIYPRGRLRFSIVGFLLVGYILAMLWEGNFFALVLMLVFVATYVFYSYILIRKPTTLELNGLGLIRDKQSYQRSELRCRWMDVDNIQNIRHLHILHTNGKHLSMTIYEHDDRIKELIQQMEIYLPEKEEGLGLLERVMKWMKL